MANLPQFGSFAPSGDGLRPLGSVGCAHGYAFLAPFGATGAVARQELDGIRLAAREWSADPWSNAIQFMGYPLRSTFVSESWVELPDS